MTRPADMSPPERFPHGTRARYVSRCRCDECRRANREYAHERAIAKVYGKTNELVSAGPVRKHLLKLRRQGVGRRTVAEACDVSCTILSEVIVGTKRQVRRRTAERVLAVTREAIADHAPVSAKLTWYRIGVLLEEGFTKAELARRFGYQRPALQLGKTQVLARTARKVERFYKQMTVGGFSL